MIVVVEPPQGGEEGRMGRTKARVVVGKTAAVSTTARVIRSRYGLLCAFRRLVELVVMRLIIVRRLGG